MEERDGRDSKDSVFEGVGGMNEGPGACRDRGGSKIVLLRQLVALLVWFFALGSVEYGS